MPTLLIQDGFKFFFYANEHLPMLIHVVMGGGYAKIDLTSLEVSPNYLKSAETKRALEIVEANRTIFVRRWNEFFAQR